MLPALLAGAGILLVAGLFIFGGDEDKAKEASEAKAQNDASASSRTADRRARGVAARQVDDATQTAHPRPRLNPRIANAIVTEGMAPTPHKKREPTSFESTADEIVYWEGELSEANRMLKVREKASAYGPRQEEKIRQNGTAEDLAEFQSRLEIVAKNLERAQARVAEVEAKLTAIRGG